MIRSIYSIRHNEAGLVGTSLDVVLAALKRFPPRPLSRLPLRGRLVVDTFHARSVRDCRPSGHRECRLHGL